MLVYNYTEALPRGPSLPFPLEFVLTHAHQTADYKAYAKMADDGVEHR
jgi:hypothetical protein